MSDLPLNCGRCGAQARVIPIDGGGSVYAYGCTHEVVVDRPGGAKTVIRACPEPANTTADTNVYRGAR